MLLSKKIFKAIGLIICCVNASLCSAQSYPSYPSSPNSPAITLPNNGSPNKSVPINNNPNNISNINRSVNNSSQQNNQTPAPNSFQPNIIISYPMNSTGATPSTNTNVGATANKRLPPEKPSTPGYDTTSSVGGPTNDQASITYGSNGNIKTQPAMKAR
jgi:hypothetical protein